jgi:hypothetical protein
MRPAGRAPPGPVRRKAANSSAWRQVLIAGNPHYECVAHATVAQRIGSWFLLEPQIAGLLGGKGATDQEEPSPSVHVEDDINFADTYISKCP